ncbi:MAG: hypothetical protein FWF76_01200 [Oscillospiraceae bacterium]|nr:hypothetical protein [Oscillospiraceae bacterium]
MPFITIETVYDVNLFNTGFPFVYNLLLFFFSATVWYGLTNFVDIKGFCPFKWIGIIICGIAVGYFIYEIWLNELVAITSGIIGTIVIAFWRHNPISIYDIFWFLRPEDYGTENDVDKPPVDYDAIREMQDISEKINLVTDAKRNDNADSIAVREAQEDIRAYLERNSEWG